MTKDEAIARLKQLQADDDTEAAHSAADEVLCDLLSSLGYADVVAAWVKVEKWYS